MEGFTQGKIKVTNMEEFYCPKCGKIEAEGFFDTKRNTTIFFCSKCNQKLREESKL